MEWKEKVCNFVTRNLRWILFCSDYVEHTLHWQVSYCLDLLFLVNFFKVLLLNFDEFGWALKEV